LNKVIYEKKVKIAYITKVTHDLFTVLTTWHIIYEGIVFPKKFGGQFHHKIYGGIGSIKTC